MVSYLYWLHLDFSILDQARQLLYTSCSEVKTGIIYILDNDLDACTVMSFDGIWDNELNNPVRGGIYWIHSQPAFVRRMDSVFCNDRLVIANLYTYQDLKRMYGKRVMFESIKKFHTTLYASAMI